MSLAIELSRLNLITAEKTKRQRQSKAQLLILRSGEIQIRLGKALIKLIPSQAIWLPHACLYSIEAITDSQIDILSFSARVTATLPVSLMQFNTPLLLTALIDELINIDYTSTPARHLFQVCLDQVHKLAAQH